MATIGVFAVIRNDDGHVLCVRQNYAPFRWTLPGGRVEPHESPLEALHREVLEEIGRRIEITSFIGAYAVPFADDLCWPSPRRARSRSLGTRTARSPNSAGSR